MLQISSYNTENANPNGKMDSIGVTNASDMGMMSNSKKVMAESMNGERGMLNMTLSNNSLGNTWNENDLSMVDMEMVSRETEGDSFNILKRTRLEKRSSYPIAMGDLIRVLNRIGDIQKRNPIGLKEKAMRNQHLILDIIHEVSN